MISAAGTDRELPGPGHLPDAADQLFPEGSMSIKTRLIWRLLASVTIAGAAATGNSADLALTASWDTFLVSEQGVPPTLSTAGFAVVDVDEDGRDEIIVGI